MESFIRYTEVTGKGWTLISKVNVRTLASVYSKWVTQIRSAGTEVEVTAEVMNSSGEIWYAVKLYQGYVGYIRGDLLRVNVEPVEKTEAEQVVIQTVKQQTSQSPRVIYVVVQSEEDVPEEISETEIIYITPEQAAELGIG